MTFCKVCGKLLPNVRFDPKETVICQNCAARMKEDLVRVVRCKDCKHGQYEEWDNGECVDKTVYCDGYGIHKPDWYCADGEKNNVKD